MLTFFISFPIRDRRRLLLIFDVTLAFTLFGFFLPAIRLPLVPVPMMIECDDYDGHQQSTQITQYIITVRLQWGLLLVDVDLYYT